MKSALKESELRPRSQMVAASLYDELTEEQVRSGRNLERAKEAFEILKHKIVSTPLLRHPDRAKQFVIIPHANPWAACAVLGQMHDGVIQPVRFTGRILNEFELRYHIAEKEMLAILRVMELFRPLIYGSASPVVIYTRYTVLKWLLNSNSIEGRCLKWGLERSRWSLEIRRVQRDEDGLAAILGAGITPREHLDAVVEELIPAKGRVKKPPAVSIEMLESDYQGMVLSFDGAAKTSTRVGSCGCVLWHLPGWEVLDARGFILEDVTRRLAEYEIIRTKFKTVQLVHVKRLYNKAADYLTSKTLALGKSWQVEDAEERLHLRLVSRIAEQVMKPSGTPNEAQVRTRTVDADLDGVRSDFDSAPLTPAAKVLAVMTRARSRGEADSSEPMGPVEYQAERWRRIKVHQDVDTFLMQIKKYLKGEHDQFSHAQVKKIAKYADQSVVPTDLRPDILHYAHEDVQGGHQGITRTYEKLRSEFYRPRMYADVEVFVKECTDCASAKGRPLNSGPSPGNIEPSRPFEVVSMDFVTHLPKAERGNTFLLLFQDAFSGYVKCKPMGSTTAQDVAEAYEERVFRPFGPSSKLRHDQDPRFMSEVFSRLRDLLGSRQRATLAYRPQANGQQERSVQTVIRSVRAYVAESDQSDWDEHAERLMFALNTCFDVTRLDMPFYLVHGLDAQGTLSAMLGPMPSSVPERSAYEWRRKMQRDYSYAQACAEDLQKRAKKMRSETQTLKWQELSDRIKAGFKVGDAVWLYIPKVQPGLSRKLARMWHGPFRIEEMHGNFRVKLKRWR
ncbi:unnamed protein product [Phytophthora fragariaefolia]|uniref:Unnamed protein product n=1 Tax=Phytophthora fragariaefolia TaxID=1490495 RepID=A0A9W6YQ62_9STRA|nr:unnamed protein product [Phytophthora fragariaefolia]